MAHPEHEKLQKVKETSQSIGEFLEWLSSTKHFIIAKYREEEDLDDYLVPTYLSTEALLAEYFGVDLNVLEDEKRKMLEHIRTLNKTGEIK